MAEIPTENPNKYGKMEDDVDELADLLAGRESRGGSSVKRGPAVPVTKDVDEDFFSLTRDSVRKYGG